MNEVHVDEIVVDVHLIRRNGIQCFFNKRVAYETDWVMYEKDNTKMKIKEKSDK